MLVTTAPQERRSTVVSTVAAENRRRQLQSEAEGEEAMARRLRAKEKRVGPCGN
jgi:hypothetical protein